MFGWFSAEVRVLVTTHSDYFLDGLRGIYLHPDLGECQGRRGKGDGIAGEGCLARTLLDRRRKGIDSGKTIVKRFEYDAESASAAHTRINKPLQICTTIPREFWIALTIQAQTLKDDEQESGNDGFQAEPLGVLKLA
ncbi:MAG: hypothetical protein ACYYK0_00935 [Candidatus Eutrophobiaceae bacterium]